MLYQKDADRYNVEISAKQSHVEGFEFDTVAVEDIPVGAPLVRKFLPNSASLRIHSSPLRLADATKMSELDVEAFISYQSEADERVAEKAGVAPLYLHKDVIYDHVRSTKSGSQPIVDCTKTVTLPHPIWDGFGVFASQDICAGDIVESGFMFPIKGLDGNRCPYVFTWNKGGERHADPTQNNWCMGGGNAMFYNSDTPANVRMYRFHDHYRYLIVAQANIREGEEVMHLYASSSWRACFVEDTALPKLLPIETEINGAYAPCV